MSRWQAVIDTRALEVASQAKEAHERHIIECRDRYVATERALAEIKDAITETRKERDDASRRLYGMLWKTAGSTIALLLIVVGWLLTHQLPWAGHQ